jgi:hypothetical protein
MVSKKQEEMVEPLDLESKDYWLRKFRMAKTQQTLTLMVERTIDQFHQKPSVLGAVYLAECQRERELETGVLLNR